MMMTIAKYEHQSAQDRVIALFKQEKENPLSVEEISFRLKMDRSEVAHVIHSIQDKYPLCQENEKYFFPDNKVIHYLSAVGIIIACAYTFFGLIQYYHV